MSNLVSFSDLKAWLGCKQDGDVERKLKDARIPYTYGIGGKPVTTLDAVNSVLIKDGKSPQETIEFGVN